MRASPLGRLAGLLPVLFSWIAVAAVPGSAQEESAIRLDVPQEVFEVGSEEWYGIYAEDNKLGFLNNKLQYDAEAEQFHVEQEMHLKVVTMGQKREVRSLETLVFSGTPPYRLLAAQSLIDQGPYRQEVRLEGDGDGYQAHIIAAGSERVLDVPDPDYTLADILTPEQWFRSTREPGDLLLVRSFSLADLAPAIDTYSVRQLRDTLVDGVEVSYYEVDLHSSTAGSIGSALIDLNGMMVSGVIGGAFEVRLEPEELARDFDYSADVYLLGLAEIDQPLGDPKSVATLVLEVDGKQPEQIPNSASQTLAYDGPSDSWRLSIGQGYGEPQPATEEAVAAAREESVEHPIYAPEIVQLAREAVGEAESPMAQVEALVGFVDQYLVDSYSAEPLTVLDMLTTREGDCTEHAMLFTTLARAVGLAAREVTGLLYLGDDTQAFGGHAWNEVALDGYWHAVDPTWGEVDINSTHISLGPRLGNDSSPSALFGGYSFRLVELERH